MDRLRRKTTQLVAGLALAVWASCFFGGVTGADLLKYQLDAKPGNITVDRMPTTDPNPKSYQEEFTFTVTNPRKSDFNGTSANCQTFEVEVFFAGVDKPTSVWKWSAGHQFCQHQTPLSIPAGKSWTPDEQVVWTFKAADAKDGKYFAKATFLPTGNQQAVANFTITSVQ